MKKLNDYQLMIRARNLVRRKDGHIKGTNKCHLGNGRYAFCARGAVFEVTQSEKIRSRMLNYLAKTIPSAERGYYDNLGYGTISMVVSHNDVPNRTKNEILAWFQRAIRKAAKASGVQVTC